MNHVGVTMTYMGLCPSGCRSSTLDLSSISWFKIHEAGYDTTIKTWFTESFIEQNSTLAVTIPRNLKAGEYLVRHEQLSLHAVREPLYGPEVFTSYIYPYLKPVKEYYIKLTLHSSTHLASNLQSPARARLSRQA